MGERDAIVCLYMASRYVFFTAPTRFYVNLYLLLYAQYVIQKKMPVRGARKRARSKYIPARHLKYEIFNSNIFIFSSFNSSSCDYGFERVAV